VHIRVSDEPSAAAAAWIAQRLRDACRRRGQASLALSGGSTAPPMIAALLRDDLPWKRITVWQVDERIVPDDDAARNALQLADLPCRVRPMPVTVAKLRPAAARYGTAMPDHFDVVHLGVGDDGHTASWPPDRPQIIASERRVELVDTFNGYKRMTITGSVVNAARSRVVLTTGASKRPMVERWMMLDGSLPISAVTRVNTIVFLDGFAAPLPQLESILADRV
jgi:6-phosphogluconolactonase/glucosamine-6-phosphate isomerase/deaminase